jgi:hypothetical protein
MSRRSFLGVAAAGLAATVLDWNKINAVAEKMGARLDRFTFSRNGEGSLLKEFLDHLPQSESRS